MPEDQPSTSDGTGRGPGSSWHVGQRIHSRAEHWDGPGIVITVEPGTGPLEGDQLVTYRCEEGHVHVATGDELERVD